LSTLLVASNWPGSGRDDHDDNDNDDESVLKLNTDAVDKINYHKYSSAWAPRRITAVYQSTVQLIWLLCFDLSEDLFSVRIDKIRNFKL
jgi:hypothetical protein